VTWNKETIKKLRSDLKLTQVEFALRLGCRQQTVSEWELGLYAPANAYCKLLNLLAEGAKQEIEATSSQSVTTKKISSFVLPQVEMPQIFLDDEPRPFDPAID